MLLLFRLNCCFINCKKLLSGSLVGILPIQLLMGRSWVAKHWLPANWLRGTIEIGSEKGGIPRTVLDHTTRGFPIVTRITQSTSQDITGAQGPCSHWSLTKGSKAKVRWMPWVAKRPENFQELHVIVAGCHQTQKPNDFGG